MADYPLGELNAEFMNNFCKKWQITELSLFGSILRDDFRSDSEIDVLVSFTLRAPWTLLNLVTMERELADLTGRDIDLIEKRVVENSDNPIRKADILNSAQVIYAEASADEPV